MIQLRGVKGPTAKLLAEMLKAKGLMGRGPITNVVNYGYAEGSELPTLNAQAGRANKLEELQMLREAGVPTVPFSENGEGLHCPILGRKLHHTRGNDIKVLRVRLAADSDYFTELVPKVNEYRVWVFRNKALATYEKTLEYPRKYGRRGRSKEVWNWKNGFAFKFIAPDAVDEELKALAVAAVAAMDLDFGGVDIIRGTDNEYYVLEVNTAPGTQGEARQGIASLVNCIARWVERGYPGRKGAPGESAIGIYA